jgi:hypothetical protein
MFQGRMQILSLPMMGPTAKRAEKGPFFLFTASTFESCDAWFQPGPEIRIFGILLNCSEA